ncbi:hypothetical protein [Xylophilus sp. GOD-11R]|uniref:hypothetical protein n=1 Tax=Xylophilus sp. GOD-11R TaxID=3089814 RepID=UPI00298C3148|nr:hypothetical protein [Xylophilus sp. GOD-11R]WPB57972.1 hypothetical protein R9X41_04815 [Xylophilus sp. GOD-11R]
MFSLDRSSPSASATTPGQASPSMTVRAGAVAEPPGEQMRLEHLPIEILMEIGEEVMRSNLTTPSTNPVEDMASLNSHFASVFREPATATRSTRPMWAATSASAFVAQMNRLAQAPASQQRWCWNSMIAALSRQLAEGDPTSPRRLLDPLIAGLPPEPPMRRRLIQQITDCLVRQPHAYVGVLERLIPAGAVEPPMPDVWWKQLMQLTVRMGRPQRHAQPVWNAVASLPPNRRAEFELLMDILDLEDTQTVPALLQRIAALSPGPISTLFYATLIASWVDCNPEQDDQGAPAFCQALLAAAEQPEQREALLALLPVDHEPPPEFRETLSRHLGTLRPEAAMRLLTTQLPAFTTDADRMPWPCADVLLRARSYPADHAAAALVLASKMPSLTTPEQRADLARLMLAECPHLPLAHRLPVLAAIAPCVGPAPVWQFEWASAWREALDTTCRAVLSRDGSMPPRDAIGALAAALPHEEASGRVPQPDDDDGVEPLPDGHCGPLLAAFALSLRSLAPQDVPDAVRDIVRAYKRDGFVDAPSSAVHRLLLRCCAELPFELRDRPLRDIHSVTTSARNQQALDRMKQRTRQEHRQWQAQACAASNAN